MTDDITAVKSDCEYMHTALKAAKKAASKGEVPVGAVIVCDGKIVSTAYNTRETGKNALYHAEIKAIDKACKKLGGWRLHKCEMYVTLEPCPMCAGAIINSRIKRVVYGAKDEKAGSFGTVTDLNTVPYNHHPEVLGGIMECECRDELSNFFSALREKKENEKKSGSI